VAVASAGPHASLHLAPDRYPCQQPTTQFFTGRMPFLPPNQQRQSTEGSTMVISVPNLKSLGSPIQSCEWQCKLQKMGWFGAIKVMGNAII